MFRVVEADLRVGFLRTPSRGLWFSKTQVGNVVSIAAFGRPFRVTVLCSRKKSAGPTTGLTRAA
jgi:hypothetical protein